MKKIISAVLLSALVFTACGRTTTENTAGNFNYKTGLATYTHTDGTYGYTDGKNGQSNVSTTIVAAVFDNNGKIIDIKIDEVESKLGFDNAGQLSGYTGEAVRSKKELRDNYGMKAASGIGKEWYQQIETLEKWLVGKDVNTIISSAKGRVAGLMDWAGAEKATWGTGNADDNMGSADGNMMGNNGNNRGTNNSTGTITGRTGGADTGMNINENSATSGSTTDGNNVVGDIANGVGDVVDGVGDAVGDIADGIMGDGTMYNTDWMDADLKAGVTIDTTYIQMAIEKAYNNAK